MLFRIKLDRNDCGKLSSDKGESKPEEKKKKKIKKPDCRVSSHPKEEENIAIKSTRVTFEMTKLSSSHLGQDNRFFQKKKK